MSFNLEEKTFLIDNNIVNEDDKCDSIIFIVKGLVGIYMIDTNGKYD